MRHVPRMMNDAHIVVSNQPYFWITLYIYNLRKCQKKNSKNKFSGDIILFCLSYFFACWFHSISLRVAVMHTCHVVSNHWNHLYSVYRCISYIIFNFHSGRTSCSSYSWLYYYTIALFVTHSVYIIITIYTDRLSNVVSIIII